MRALRLRVISWLGWYGVLAILAAYALVTFEVVGVKSYTYQLLNLSGALGIVAVAASKKDRQPMVLNLVWAVVALAAIIHLALR
jgi:hypothetical protein